jgi:hypothetical protein
MHKLPGRRVLLRWMFNALGLVLTFGGVIHSVLRADFWAGLFFAENAADHESFMAAAFFHLPERGDALLGNGRRPEARQSVVPPVRHLHLRSSPLRIPLTHDYRRHRTLRADPDLIAPASGGRPHRAHQAH